MNHSVKLIGNNYQELSYMRNDLIKFNATDFFNFAKENMKKYAIIDTDNDLLVSTWHSDALINDYQKTIKQRFMKTTEITATKQQQADMLRELGIKVNTWVDRNFNHLHLEVLEKWADNALFEYIRGNNDTGDLDDDTEQDNYPMWNTLFEFKSNWHNDDETAEKCLAIGLGVISGLDPFNTILFMTSAGHSFLSAYWIPLYFALYPDEAAHYAELDYNGL